MLPFLSTFLAQATQTNPCNAGRTECSYTFLEPVPGFGTSTVVSSSTLSTYFDAVYTYVIVIICVIAVFFLMYYGILFLTTDIISKKMEGREGVVKVITGIVFIFSAWVLLNSINPNMLRNTIFGDGSITSVGSTPPPGGCSEPGGCVPPPNTPSGNEQAVREQLAAAGITINQRSPITQVGGVDSSLIQTIISLKQACNCTIVITGGSEQAGHSPNSNHYKGKAIDLRYNDTLNSFLQSNGTRVNANLCTDSYRWNGWIFTDENCTNAPRHFHVSPTGN